MFTIPTSWYFLYHQKTINLLRFKKLIVFFFFSFICLATATPLKPYVFNNHYRHLSEYYQFIEDCNTLSTQQVLQKFNSGAFKSQKPNTPFTSGISTCSN